MQSRQQLADGTDIERGVGPDVRPLARPVLVRNTVISRAGRRMTMYVGMLATDTLAIALGYLIAERIVGGTGTGQAARMIMLIVPLFWLAAFNMGAYSLATLTDVFVSLRRSLVGLAYAATAVVFIAYFTKSSADFSRLTFGTGAIVAAVLLTLARVPLRAVARAWCGPTAIHTEVLLDGAPDPCIPHATVVDLAAHGLSPNNNDPYSLDRLAQHLRGIDQVVIACPPERRAQWALILKGANIHGEIIDPQVAELAVLGSRRYDNVGSLIVSTGALAMRQRMAKRALDLSLAAIVLLLVAPLMTVVALAIFLEDRGPVLFVQERVGRANRLFRIYKFRSMRVESTDATGSRSATRDDDRVTRVGAIIRALSIDEVPQLLNIVKGDMSFVGPRPHALGSTAGGQLFWHVDARYWHRHALKPGLTGLAQVKGLRGATHHASDLVGRLQADLDYVADWSIRRDIGILLRTFGVLFHRNAY